MEFDVERWITDKLKMIMRLLADKNYEPLTYYLESAYLEKHDVDNFLMWLYDYCDSHDGKRLVTYPPDNVFHSGSKMFERESEYCTKGNREFWGCFNLWIDGEESDLTLEYEVKFNDNDIRFYMHNIHVM